MTALLIPALLTCALLVGDATAHGGEDHAAPAASVATEDGTTGSVASSSAQFEAVLRVHHGAPGSPVATKLLLADFATSEPIADATSSLALQGPASVTMAFSPASPVASAGIYIGSATFPAAGEYAGALIIATASGSDVIPITGLLVGATAPAATLGAGMKVARALAGVGVLGIGGFLAVALGYAIGRRRGVGAAAMLVAAMFAAREGLAHGGEGHTAPAAPAGEPGNAPRPAGAAYPGGALASGALHLPMESQFLIGMRTARLMHDTFQERVPALGKFVARAGGSATLRSPVAGELGAPTAGFPSPGSAVHAGQVLGVVRELVGSADRASLAESRQQAATAVAEAKKAVALAERDVAQLARLSEGISERERLERQQSAYVARTTLSEAEAALAAMAEGSGVVIRAPVAGRVGSALARPGDQVQAGDALFRVVDASGLWMEARVPERFAAGITAGSVASVLSTAWPGVPLPAVILDAGQEADPATGTLTVTLAVDALGHDLHPGMSGTAWLGRGPTRDALVVPDAAVIDSNGIPIGFVKVGPEQFEMRELRLGARSGDEWSVIAGLGVGERVVLDGTYTLRSLAGR